MRETFAKTNHGVCEKCGAPAQFLVVKYGKTYSFTTYFCNKHLPRRFKPLKGVEEHA